MGQLPDRFWKREPFCLLQPADGISAFGADKAVDPVGFGADREAGGTVVVPGAAGQKFPARLAQRTRLKQIDNLGPLAHLLDQSVAQQPVAQ